MTLKTLVLACVLATSSAAVLAQSASAPASSPAKKALVAKILQLQQPGIENMARQLVERPASELMQQAAMAMQQMPADKREAVGKDIQADARKYVDEAYALVRTTAIKLAPSTIGPVLEANFNEDELKQIIAILESPVNRKFQQMGPDMQKAIGEKLIGDTRASVEPKVRALEQGIGKRLKDASAAAPAAAPKP